MNNKVMKEIISKLLPFMLAFAVMLSFGAYAKAETTAQQTDVIEISSAEELNAINQNLSGHYALAADIDLGGKEWTPIGSFAPSAPAI